VKKFKLKNIRPNPYRDLLRFPVQPEKVKALVRSIKATGFWPTLVGRVRGDKVEIPFGHNRLAALKEVYGPNYEIPITIEDRTDSDFIKMMELENAEEYGNDVSSTIQSVRSVVTAFATGTVELPKVGAKARKDTLLFAPYFIKGRCADKLSAHPYTAVSLAMFFECEETYNGETTAPPKIEAALAALELEEMKVTGFDAKALDLMKTPDGKLPVKKLLDATKTLKVRAEVSAVREQAKAQRETEQRKSEAQRAAEAKAEADKAQKELDKIAAHKAKALTEKLEAQRLQDIADAKQRLADAKAKAEAMKAEWDAGEAERKKERVAAERAAVAETARKEGRRASHVKSIVEKVERVLVDDSLYELIRDLKKTTALTPAERKNLKTALQDAGVRFREHASKF